ncbi:unnamed protein product [Toxocara canis]|uniref:Hexosyltransferase n=1 Tax=Toxocara canis TaxID=6265 RepID=A0A183UJI0_TOXCA|nr:unnamed protein product [Toxocara canis]
METRGRNELQLANFNNPDNKEVSKVLHLAVFQQWKLDDCGRPREKHNAMVIERNAFNWTIVNKHFCTKRYPNLKMLIVVLSAVENFETRKIYREMYGDHFYKERGVVTLFVVGRSLNNSINEKILEENYAHHDIIQQNFLDAYKNLTLKGLAWLQFVVDYCSNVQYVMKTDDDVVFNLYGLVDYLRIHFSNSSRIDDENRFICGMMHNLTAPRDPSKCRRNSTFSNNKKTFICRCVTRDEYKFDEFPPYCMGLQYIITPRIAAKLLEASVGEKFIWVRANDVVLTGENPQTSQELLNELHSNVKAIKLKVQSGKMQWMKNEYCPGFDMKLENQNVELVNSYIRLRQAIKTATLMLINFQIEDYFFTGQIGQKINAKYHDISALRGQKEQFLNMTALFWLAHETHMAEGKEAWRNVRKHYRQATILKTYLNTLS